MRADRLLSLLWLVKARGKLTASDAAAELEVSVRTVYRDVEALSAAGVPLYCDRGRNGGIALLPGYRTDVTGLNEAESAALLASITPSGTDALGLSAPLASALRKVTAALPDASRKAAILLSERVLIDPVGWLPERSARFLPTLQQAVLEDRRLRIKYQSWGDDAASLRTIDPLGLVNSAGVWYLDALHRGESRFYRIPRITSVKLLDDPSTRPPEFDLRESWTARRQGFRDSFVPLTATLRVRTTRLGELGELVDQPDAGSGSEPWATVTAHFGDIGHMLHLLTPMGADVEVLAPPSARNAILAHARSILSAY